MSAFACPSTEYVKGLMKLKEKMSSSLKLPTPIWCIEPCYENKTRSKKLNLDNKCFQQL